MNHEMYTKMTQMIAGEIAGLMEEHEEGIKAAIVKKVESTDNGKIKVPLAFNVTLHPMGDTCGAKLKLSYGEKTCDESECTVDLNEKLPGFDAKK